MKQYYDALIGEKNLYYYQTKFDGFDKKGPGTHPSWNWPAFFVPGLWALYRKMYSWFCIIILSSSFFNIIGITSKNETVFIINLIISVVIQILFAMFANSLYQENLSRKIMTAKRTISNENRLIDYLKYKGCVNAWVPWATIVLWIIVFMLFIRPFVPLTQYSLV